MIDQGEGTVALWEAIAEARTLLEDITRQGEELKVREERLGELLAPSEAALRARTEYLDKVTREHLSRAEQRITAAAESLKGLRGPDPYTRALMEASVPRSNEMPFGRRLVLQLLVMLLGGFLAGTLATWRTSRQADFFGLTVTAPQPSPSPTKAPRARPAVAR